MLAAVELDDKRAAEADEVADKIADWTLAAEAKATQLAAAKLAPERRSASVALRRRSFAKWFMARSSPLCLGENMAKNNNHHVCDAPSVADYRDTSPETGEESELNSSPVLGEVSA